VDCSGLFLPEQSRSFSGRTGAGHIFAMNARLADQGVPQIAAVSGDCIAGGGYMPIISDRVAMTESAYVVIAGAALVRGAKALKLTSLDIGGPEVHVHMSRVADVRVPDDAAAVAWVRAEVDKLPTSGVPFWRHGAEPSEPVYPPSDLNALVPADHRHPYDVDELLARLVDDSLFHEVLPGVGREMVTGVARVDGLWCGFVANRQGLVEEPGVGRRPGGVLYREGIARIAAFARACGDDGIPLVWLQDIGGFDIGVEAERLGLLGYGSSLIYANSTARAPVFTVLLRKASGAGYYAMHGLPYEPIVQLATPLTRLAVMEGRTLAIATYNSRLDDDFEIATSDPVERAAIEKGMAETAARIEADMDPVAAAARMDVDEVVPLPALRAWLVTLVRAAWQGTGYRRVKNPRIWSLHDIEVLGRGVAAGSRLTALAQGDALGAPTVGHFEPVIGAGATVGEGTLLGRLHRAGLAHDVVAPQGASGSAVAIHAGDVERGSALVVLGAAAAHGSAARRAERQEAADGEDVRSESDGTVWLRASPGAPPFFAAGDAVEAGATLALVEVMKTFAPVRAPRAGVLIGYAVSDGASVEGGTVVARLRT
jgi:acetyl-CoA carboxylase carboxyltransferase component